MSNLTMIVPDFSPRSVIIGLSEDLGVIPFKETQRAGRSRETRATTPPPGTVRPRFSLEMAAKSRPIGIPQVRSRQVNGPERSNIHRYCSVMCRVRRIRWAMSATTSRIE